MKNNYPKGSMGEAEAQSTKRFLIVAAIIIVIIFSMVYLGVPHTNLIVWHRKASMFWKVVGVIPFAGSIIFLALGRDATATESGSGGTYGLIAIGLVALGILCGCGWNFDL